MNVPAGLLQAVSDETGGRLAIVIGAGCSVDPPTAIPLARDLSLEACRRLVLDQVLEEGECADPSDLALLASVVFQKTGNQDDIVSRLPLARFRLAKPNLGYLLLVALMAEGAVSYVLSLNFDLAVQNAAATLGVVIEVVDGQGKPVPMVPSVIHLHGSVNGPAEAFVLRTEALNDEWRGAWEQVVANQILAAPNVLFVGLGSAAPVLTETIAMISEALGQNRTIYQADISTHGESHFAQQLGVSAERYVERDWLELMAALASRVAAEQVHSLAQSGAQNLALNHAPQADLVAFAELAARHAELSLLALGNLRAIAMLDLRASYVPRSQGIEDFMVEPMTRLGTLCDVLGLRAVPTSTGLWCLERDGSRVATALLVTGRGTRRIVALESGIRQISQQIAESTLAAPDIVLVGGTQAEPATENMQVDIIEDQLEGDLISGPAVPLTLIANDTDILQKLEQLLNAA